MRYRGWFFAFDHQNKARSYVNALSKYGYRRTYTYDRALVALSDLDVAGRVQTLAPIVSNGGLAFLYPHAARPPIQWDGICTPWDGIAAHFVANEGSAEVMRRYGYPRPVHVVGWGYCDQRPFVPNPRYRFVLWGPIHANNNGYLNDVHVQDNRAVLQRLRRLVSAGRIHLTIRYIRSLRECGLDAEMVGMGTPGIALVKGRPDLSTDDIDRADVVVGHQTFTYLAIARGKPTVMMHEDLPPCSGNSDDNFQYVKSWGLYHDYMRYPVDILDYDDPETAFKIAAAGSDDIARWRSLFIGEPFNDRLLAETVNSYVDRRP